MNVLLAVSDRFFGDALINFTCQHHNVEHAHYKFVKVVLPEEKQPGGSAEDRKVFFDEEFLLAKKLLEKLSLTLLKRKTDCIVSFQVLVGIPGKEVVDYATKWPADMIILGAHEQSNFERMLLGSVSTYIAEHSPCSFSIVRIANDEVLDLDLNESEVLEDLGISVS